MSIGWQGAATTSPSSHEVRDFGQDPQARWRQSWRGSGRLVLGGDDVTCCTTSPQSIRQQRLGLVLTSHSSVCCTSVEIRTWSHRLDVGHCHRCAERLHVLREHHEIGVWQQGLAIIRHHSRRKYLQPCAFFLRWKQLYCLRSLTLFLNFCGPQLLPTELQCNKDSGSPGTNLLSRSTFLSKLTAHLFHKSCPGSSRSASAITSSRYKLS